MEEVKKQLDFIEEMIASAKTNLATKSIFYLIWGWLVLLAALINYYLLEFTELTNGWMVWPILMSLGGSLSIIVGIRLSKKTRVKSKIDKILERLWLGFFITLVAVLSGVNAIGAETIYPTVIALYGLGTFVSGSIINFKPFQVGAVIAWVCASVAFYMSFNNQLILISIAIIFSYIIPGHLLASKK